jgi:ligand-binding SRPBCC domain-containing protein
LDKHLEETPLLDFSHPSLVALVERRGWRGLPPYDAIGAIYDFVRNDVAFGYNASDDLPASAVLRDGYGQCNTKGTLLMALLRSVGVRCRFHGFTIHKKLQRGAIPEAAYWLAPKNIVHSWIEVFHDSRWINLEGFILDAEYLDGVRCLLPDASGPFCGYAVGTRAIENPPVEWNGTDTYIQRTGINHDFGIFHSPDAFYERHGANLSGLRRHLFAHAVRHFMNRRITSIRDGRLRGARSLRLAQNSTTTSNRHRFEISSRLAAPAEVVWAHCADMRGVCEELAPWFRMTFPPEARMLDGASTGERLFRSWLLLFGIFPMEYDDLTFVDIAPGRGFVERSEMGTQRVWQHERRLEPVGESTVVTDVLEWTGRFPGAGELFSVVVPRLFRWRHRRLRRKFGDESPYPVEAHHNLRVKHSRTPFRSAHTSNGNHSKTSMKAGLSSLRHVHGSSPHIVRSQII